VDFAGYCDHGGRILDAVFKKLFFPRDRAYSSFFSGSGVEVPLDGAFVLKSSASFGLMISETVFIPQNLSLASQNTPAHLTNLRGIRSRDGLPVEWNAILKDIRQFHGHPD
jgi:hypothetical protein